MKFFLFMSMVVFCFLNPGITRADDLQNSAAREPSSLQKALNQEAATNHEQVFTKEYQEKVDSTLHQDPTDADQEREQVKRDKRMDHYNSRAM
jgi:ABC-type transporter Mla subunit MlaD